VTPRIRDRAGTIGVVTLLFTAVTVIIAYPLSIHPGSMSMGSDPDVHLVTWILAWDVHALTDRPLHIFDANILYPYSNTLAFSENLIGSVIFAAPAIWLTGNPVVAMNVVSLASCVLCALGAFVLARRLGLGIPAAIVCGLVFGFSPARFFRFGQTHLTTIQWIPFALASLISYLDEGRRRDLWLATFFFSLQALTSGHGAVYLGLAGAGYVGFRFATGTSIAMFGRLRDFGSVGVLLLAPALLIVPPYLQVQREMGLKRTLENWETAPESFLASPTLVHSRLLSAFSARRVNERASAFLFPGYLPLLLAAVALGFTTRGGPYRQHAWFFLLLTILSALLSAGPPLGLWPYVYWLPGINFIRIPSRFMLLGILGIAVLAGMGFERLASWLRGDTRLVVEIVVAMLLVAEFWTPLTPQPYRVAFPSVDRWLDSQPKPFAIAEVPVRPLVRYHSTYMLHSMAHWQRTVHGHSGLETPLHLKLYDELRTFPDDASVENLQLLGVKYVVVHIDWYRPGEWDRVRPEFDRYASVLTLVHEDESGRVYAINLR
jgi:hypothetical protein